MKKRYLTKSKFKLTLKCSRQLYYAVNPDKYANKNIDDPFLKALADGGFQVGALANQMIINEYVYENYYIADYDHDIAIEKTNKLLEKDQVIIFEPAFLYNNCFIRCDILIKNNNHIQILEVKSKSFTNDSCINLFIPENWQYFKNQKRNSYNGILNKQKVFKKNPEFFVKKNYEEYIYDIAFQAWVLNNINKNLKHRYEIDYFLFTPSKDLVSSVDRLNQKFFIKQNKSGHEIIYNGDISSEGLGEDILKQYNVNWVVNAIHNNQIKNIYNFDLFIKDQIKIVQDNIKPEKNISSACKTCPFSLNSCDKINGFSQCLSEVSGKSIDEIAKKKTVYDLWHNTNASKQVICDKRIFLEDLDYSPAPISADPLNRDQRQNLQVLKYAEKTNKEFFNKIGLKNEMNNFKYPLHFIDFETSMSAIPFRKNQKPYQMIFFQFSHHILTENGDIQHVGQYINLKPCINPNIDAVRALYHQLKNDEGTIFRWSMHENTVLRKVYDEVSLLSEEVIPEKKELLNFIDAITRGGDREMIDMWVLYKQYHYLPETNGSNSIKFVLPAIMNKFENFNKVFKNNIYGKNELIKSLNFDSIAWIKKDSKGNVYDPYKMLPKVFKDYEKEQLDLIYGDNELKNGGSAMIAYAVCQFTKITDIERKKLERALLRYCELDTFAMVIIYLYWIEQVYNTDSLQHYKGTYKAA